MKHALQKIAIAIAICMFVITGCQKDDGITTEQSIDKGVTITKISFEEFKKNQKAFNEFKKLIYTEGIRPKSREYGDGYYYDTEEVTLISYSDSVYSYKSYIFPMRRDIPANTIENLLIWEKSTGETAKLFLEYNLTEGDFDNFFNGREIEDLEDKIIMKSGPGDVYVGLSTWKRPDGTCWTPKWQDPGDGTPQQPQDIGNHLFHVHKGIWI